MNSNFIHKVTRSKSFQARARKLLMELCQIDTSPKAKPAQIAAAKDQCFRILERELAGFRLERRPINPAIERHPNFSRTTCANASAKKIYAGRSNLLCFVPGQPKRAAGQSVALNAHIDVVAPYFPPRVRGGVVYGRGACDDKGPVVGMVLALKLLAEAGVALNRDALAMFVIEEETGGNGSLSLAIDRDLKRSYDSILVGECTGLKIHPANRGAVWFRIELRPPAGVSALEMITFVHDELEKEGAALRAESHHPLFPQRPVQTCHGILGPFGEHPSRICGEAAFAIEFSRQPGEAVEKLARDCLEWGCATYCGLYGDKTKVLDDAGKPMVARHYQLRREARKFIVDVYGATGHMGAIRERDGAITKLAHLARALIYSRARLESIGGPMRFELPGLAADKPLVLEGGQGFVPTHAIGEVMERLRAAARRGAATYFRRIGREDNSERAVTMTFEKLHNTAFDGDPNSPSMRNALAAAKSCGLPLDGPVAGWTVSCDARLFATEYPKMDVLTFGPGQLADAHSDHEKISLEEIRLATEFLAEFILRQTATLESA